MAIGVPIPRAQFYQKYGQKYGNDPSAYNRYVRYVRNVPRRRKAARIAQYGSENLVPLTDQQIAAQTAAYLEKVYGPQRQNITSRYDDRIKSGSAALEHYTGQLAQYYQGLPQAANQSYSNDLASRAALSGALAGAVQGQGAQAGADMSKFFQLQGNQPAAGDQFANLSQARGTQAATDITNLGNTDLNQLLTERSTTGDYLSMLPGIAAMQGQYTLADFVGGLENERTQALADLDAERSSAGADFSQRLMDREIQKATLVEAYVKSRQQQDNTNLQNSYDYADYLNQLGNAYGYVVTGTDANGNPVFAKDPNGGKVPYGGPPQPDKPVNTEATKRANAKALRDDRLKWVDDATNLYVWGSIDPQSGQGGLAGPGGGGVKMPSRQAYQVISGRVKAAHPKWTPTQIRNETVNAMRAAGYTDFSYLSSTAAIGRIPGG